MAVRADDHRLARDAGEAAASDRVVRLEPREDARLVEALRAARPGAFTELVTRYQDAVFSLALRLVRDREEARDVAQDVFLKAYGRIPKTEGEMHLWAWLYRVTVNTCWDHLREASRRPLPSDEAVDLAASAAADEVERAELAKLFTESLAAIPPRQQAALVLKDVHGLNHADIADTLGISRASSEILLFRARRSFRSAFSERAAEQPAAPVCRLAEKAAAASVGGRLSAAQRHKVVAHARTCEACRTVTDGWRGGRSAGLALVLPLVAAPHLFGGPAGVTAAASAGISAAAHGAASAASAGAGSVGAAAGGGGTLGGGAVSGGAAVAGAAAPVSVAATSSGAAFSAAGGLAAKLAGVGLAKVAVVAVAATSIVAAGGVQAYRSDHAPHSAAGPHAVATARSASRAAAAARPSAAQGPALPRTATGFDAAVSSPRPTRPVFSGELLAGLAPAAGGLALPWLTGWPWTGSSPEGWPTGMRGPVAWAAGLGGGAAWRAGGARGLGDLARAHRGGTGGGSGRTGTGTSQAAAVASHASALGQAGSHTGGVTSGSAAGSSHLGITSPRPSTPAVKHKVTGGTAKPGKPGITGVPIQPADPGQTAEPSQTSKPSLPLAPTAPPRPAKIVGPFDIGVAFDASVADDVSETDEASVSDGAGPSGAPAPAAE